MSVVVLASASGAPGVTTTALGLALTWPRDVLLLDADRTPSQAIAAGYLRGQSLPSQGLLGVLSAQRERRDLLAEVEEQRVPLPTPPTKEGAPAERWFLPGFVHLGAVDAFAGVWASLGEALREAEFDTLVDAGRLGLRGLPDDQVRTAHLVAVVTRTSLRSLAALRLYLGPLLDQVDASRVGLVLVGPGRPYPAHEIAAQFGVPVVAEIGWHPRPADELGEGVPLGNRWHSTALARAYATAAQRLVGQLDADRARVGRPA